MKMIRVLPCYFFLAISVYDKNISAEIWQVKVVFLVSSTPYLKVLSTVYTEPFEGRTNNIKYCCTVVIYKSNQTLYTYWYQGLRLFIKYLSTFLSRKFSDKKSHDLGQSGWSFTSDWYDENWLFSKYCYLNLNILCDVGISILASVQ